MLDDESTDRTTSNSAVPPTDPSMEDQAAPDAAAVDQAALDEAAHVEAAPDETPKKAPRRRATKAAGSDAVGGDVLSGASAAPAGSGPAAPIKRTRRKVAASATAATSGGAPATEAPAPEALVDSAAADSAVTASSDAALADAASGPPATPAPRKRVARRRSTSAAGAQAEPVLTADDAQVGADDAPAGPGDAAVAEDLMIADAPVIDAVEDDPRVAEAAVDDVTTSTMSTSDAADAEPAADAAPTAPAASTARTRRRAPAIVTFQAPDPIEALELEADDSDVTDDSDLIVEDAPVKGRTRRRAGTSGAVAAGDLLPTMLAPEAPAEAVRSGGGAELDPPTGALDEDEDDESGRPRRRRRGRRGRGARPDEGELEPDTALAPATGDAADPVDDGTVSTTATSETGAAADGQFEDEEDGAGGTKRRRRRRRRGSSANGDAGDGAEEAGAEPATVVHVREPRAPRVRGEKAADEDGVRGITGSTRMAAKRARRQEGRDSGKRRPPILSEAEFLARRESVDRVMAVRQRGELTQIAVLEDGILVEHYVTKASASSYAGNVYLGRVQNVLPSMEAAFVDVGKGRNAVLYAGEVNYDAGIAGSGPRKIEQALKSGQEVLVQVSKDPMGAKGARLTSQISLPGRYLVYVPEGSMTGISRKLPEVERARLKAILKKVVPEDAGVIIRTAAEGAAEEEIAADVQRLQAQWESIRTKAAKGGAPTLLHAEPDLVIRVVRDVFNEDFAKLVIQGDSEWETIREYVESVAPDLAPRLSRHTAETDIFTEHRVDEQLAKALDRKVYLPSGGSLVIDRTEAMVVIDVNTGKFVGKGGNLEETVTRNNLEAAEEVARQLRLRDLGGIIVVDFIDMVLEGNRDLVVRRLVECMARDRTKHQVAEVTSLGLVQMTRKRVGQGLLESFSETCEHCNGRGVIVRTDPVEAPQADRVQKIERIASAARRQTVGTAPYADAATAVVAEPAGPVRRRRGGRSAGAAAVRPEEELAELLTEPAGSEVPPGPLDAELLDADLLDADVLDADLLDADVVAAETVEVDAGPIEAGLERTPIELPGVADPAALPPDLVPEMGDQPPPADEDWPVLPDLLDAPGQRAAVGEPDGADRGPATTGGAAVLEGAPTRRRRRATSRPTGPPAST